MADDATVGVEQVQLEARVNDHDDAKQFGQVVTSHMAVLDQHVFLDDVVREIAVQLLADFLLVHRRGIHRDEQKHRADTEEQHEQHRDQLDVKAVKHRR